MRDYKELKKTNTFIEHAADIRKIGIDRDVDVGVAADMWIADNHIKRTEDLMKQYKEYTQCCREDTLDGIVKALEQE